jgi:hypothetical protein
MCNIRKALDLCSLPRYLLQIRDKSLAEDIIPYRLISLRFDVNSQRRHVINESQNLRVS